MVRHRGRYDEFRLGGATAAREPALVREAPGDVPERARGAGRFAAPTGLLGQALQASPARQRGLGLRAARPPQARARGRQDRGRCLSPRRSRRGRALRLVPRAQHDEEDHMRRSVPLFLTALAALAGCGIPEEKYNATVNELNKTKATLDDTRKRCDQKQAQLDQENQK